MADVTDGTDGTERLVPGTALPGETEVRVRKPLARRSRFERSGKGERGGFILTERDEELLTDLFTHGLMDRGQIQELYFSSVPRCNARLRQLFDHGFVTRAFAPNAPYGGQGQYRAGRAAARVIAARLDLDAGEVRKICRTGTDSLQYVEHTLAIVDFYLALRRATAKAAVTIETWLPEMLCRHEYKVRDASGQWRAQVFKPDAFVRLAAAERLWSFFVEIDRGHTSSGKFAEKLAFHERYGESGLFREMYGADSGIFWTLVVTTGERRLEHLRAIVEKEKSDLFWMTTFAALETEGVLAPIWRVPGRAARHALTSPAPFEP
ncbi:MAG: replication-relaxation family protein [Armatimonadota bacterium]